MMRIDPSGMQLILREEIPGLPPSANAIWRRTARTMYKTSEAKEWQDNATTILRLKHGRKKTYEGAVYVEVVCYTRRHKSIDADNRIKAAQDCLEKAGIIKNDRQAIGSAGWKLPTKKRDHTIIEVWGILEDAEERE